MIKGGFTAGTVTINGNLTVTGTIASLGGSPGTEINAANIATNTTNIAINTGNIATNAATITTNAVQIAGMTATIAENQSLNSSRIDINTAGIASALAMAQLSEAGPGEELVLSIGGGAWDGRTALAAGLSGRINQTFSVRGAASLASGNAGVSAAVGWRLR